MKHSTTVTYFYEVSKAITSLYLLAMLLLINIVPLEFAFIAVEVCCLKFSTTPRSSSAEFPSLCAAWSCSSLVQGTLWDQFLPCLGEISPLLQLFPLVWWPQWALSCIWYNCQGASWLVKKKKQLHLVTKNVYFWIKSQTYKCSNLSFARKKVYKISESSIQFLASIFSCSSVEYFVSYIW